MAERRPRDWEEGGECERLSGGEIHLALITERRLMAGTALITERRRMAPSPPPN